MAKKGEFPKAIFYDSKNTLWAWDEVWLDACKNLLRKYESKVNPEDFQKLWSKHTAGANHRTAFGKFRKFTETLKEGLADASSYFGLPGDPETDVKFMTDRWIDVQPYPDTIEAFKRQKELVKVLCYSNVETEYLDMMVNKLGDVRPHFVGDMDKSQCCKPSPRAYRWALETASRELNLELNYSNVIYCAGPQWDVQGAMALGMKGCWIRRPTRITPEPQGVRPDYIVDNLHELTKIVEDCLAGDRAW